MAAQRLLNAEEAVDIRELYASGDYTIRNLADMYNVGPNTVWRILTGKSYRADTGGIPVFLPNGRHTFPKVGAKGAKHPLHLLNDDEVIEIRRKVAKNGTYGKKMKLYKSLAKKYGVSEITIASIATSASWKHLPSVAELRRKKNG